MDTHVQQKQSKQLSWFFCRCHRTSVEQWVSSRLGDTGVGLGKMSSAEKACGEHAVWWTTAIFLASCEGFGVCPCKMAWDANIRDLLGHHGADLHEEIPAGLAAWAQYAQSSGPAQEQEVGEVQGGSFLDRTDAFNAVAPAETRGRKHNILSSILAEPAPNVDAAVSAPCSRAFDRPFVPHRGRSPMAITAGVQRVPAVVFHKYLDRLSHKARFSGLVGTANVVDIVQEVLRHCQVSAFVDQGVFDIAYVLDPSHFHLASGVVIQKMCDLSFWTNAKQILEASFCIVDCSRGG